MLSGLGLRRLLRSALGQHLVRFHARRVAHPFGLFCVYVCEYAHALSLLAR